MKKETKNKLKKWLEDNPLEHEDICRDIHLPCDFSETTLAVIKEYLQEYGFNFKTMEYP